MEEIDKQETLKCKGPGLSEKPGAGFLPVQSLQAGPDFPVKTASSTGCVPAGHWYPTLQKASPTKTLNPLRNLAAVNHRSAYLYILL